MAQRHDGSAHQQLLSDLDRHIQQVYAACEAGSGSVGACAVVQTLQYSLAKLQKLSNGQDTDADADADCALHAPAPSQAPAAEEDGLGRPTMQPAHPAIPSTQALLDPQPQGHPGPDVVASASSSEAACSTDVQGPMAAGQGVPGSTTTSSSSSSRGGSGSRRTSTAGAAETAEPPASSCSRAGSLDAVTGAAPAAAGSEKGSCNTSSSGSTCQQEDAKDPAARPAAAGLSRRQTLDANAPPFVPGRLATATSWPLMAVGADAVPTPAIMSAQQQVVALTQQAAHFYHHLHQQQQGMPGYHLQYPHQQIRPSAGLPPLPPMHLPVQLAAPYALQQGAPFPLQQVQQQQQEVQYVLVTPMAPQTAPAAELEEGGGSQEDAEAAGAGSDDFGGSPLPDTGSYAPSEASDSATYAPGPSRVAAEPYGLDLQRSTSSSSSSSAWQQPINWAAVFQRPAAAAAAAAAGGGVAASVGSRHPATPQRAQQQEELSAADAAAEHEGRPTARQLHEKLLSPDRMKKSPLETKAAADARQARAERLRCEQLEEKLARLARAKAERQAARTCKEDQAEATLARASSKHERSAALRDAHLKRIKAKALDETLKVKEVTFINSLKDEERKAVLQQRLEEGEQRRAEQLAALQAKRHEAAASVREAQERRRALEEQRLAQLASKQQRKADAQVKRAEDQRAVAAAREGSKREPREVAQKVQAARQQEMADLNSHINERLTEAAERRLRQLELIQERAALGKDFDRRDNFLDPRSVSPAAVRASWSPRHRPGALQLASPSAVIAASSNRTPTGVNVITQGGLFGRGSSGTAGGGGAAGREATASPTVMLVSVSAAGLQVMEDGRYGVDAAASAAAAATAGLNHAHGHLGATDGSNSSSGSGSSRAAGGAHKHKISGLPPLATHAALAQGPVGHTGSGTGHQAGGSTASSAPCSSHAGHGHHHQQQQQQQAAHSHLQHQQQLTLLGPMPVAHAAAATTPSSSSGPPLTGLTTSWGVAQEGPNRARAARRRAVKLASHLQQRSAQAATLVAEADATAALSELATLLLQQWQQLLQVLQPAVAAAMQQPQLQHRNSQGQDTCPSQQQQQRRQGRQQDQMDGGSETPAARGATSSSCGDTMDAPAKVPAISSTSSRGKGSKQQALKQQQQLSAEQCEVLGQLVGAMLGAWEPGLGAQTLLQQQQQQQRGDVPGPELPKRLQQQQQQQKQRLASASCAEVRGAVCQVVQAAHLPALLLREVVHQNSQQGPCLQLLLRVVRHPPCAAQLLLCPHAAGLVKACVTALDRCNDLHPDQHTADSQHARVDGLLQVLTCLLQLRPTSSALAPLQQLLAEYTLAAGVMLGVRNVFSLFDQPMTDPMQAVPSYILHCLHLLSALTAPRTGGGGRAHEAEEAPAVEAAAASSRGSGDRNLEGRGRSSSSSSGGGGGGGSSGGANATVQSKGAGLVSSTPAAAVAAGQAQAPEAISSSSGAGGGQALAAGVRLRLKVLSGPAQQQQPLEARLIVRKQPPKLVLPVPPQLGPCQAAGSGSGVAIPVGTAQEQQQQQQQPRQGAPSSEVAAIMLALQETDMAGLLLLLTAVLLHAAPTCTPAEASPQNLPSNFVEAAHLVILVLNNVTSLDVRLAQQLLSATNCRVEFFHLMSFLLSYCTHQWPADGGPQGGSQAMEGPARGSEASSSSHGVSAASAGAGNPSAAGGSRPGGAAAAAAAAVPGAERPRRSSSAGTVQTATAAAAGGGREAAGTGGAGQVQVAQGPVSYAAAARKGGAQAALRLSGAGAAAAGVGAARADGMSSGGHRAAPAVVTTTTAAASAAAAPVVPAAAAPSAAAAAGAPQLGVNRGNATGHPLAALLNQVILLLGAFCRGNPSHQGMLQWGRTPTILQRLCGVPGVYLVQEPLRGLYLSTLREVCWRNERARDTVRAHVAPELRQYLCLEGSC